MFDLCVKLSTILTIGNYSHIQVVVAGGSFDTKAERLFSRILGLPNYVIVRGMLLEVVRVGKFLVQLQHLLLLLLLELLEMFGLLRKGKENFPWGLAQGIQQAPEIGVLNH